MGRWEKLANPSLWRKIAVGMWGRPREPTIYGSVTARADRMLAYLDELEEATGERITPTAFFVKAVAEFLARHPNLNVIVVGNTVRRRKDVDIFCQVAIPREEGADADLSGFKIPDCDERDLVEIARYIRERAERVRTGDDGEIGRKRSLLRAIPGVAMPALVRLMEALTFLVPGEFEGLGIGSDPFGSAMVSSIGSFDIDNAFAPLVPASRSPLVVLPGAIHQEPVVDDEGEVVAREVIEICSTGDHRCYDGYQGAKYVDALRAMVEHPREHFVDPEEVEARGET